MSRSRSLLAGALAAVLGLALYPSGDAAAQRYYRLELGGAGSYSSYDKATELAGAVGGMARLGYWISQRFTLEVSGAWAGPKSQNGSTVNVLALGGALLVNFPVSLHSSLYLKAGYASVTYGESSCPAVSVVGAGPCGNAGSVQGGAGLRIALSPTLMLRTEALIDHSTSPSFSNVLLSAGLSLMPGAKLLTDLDGDLVYDRYDRCPGTPAGAIVDKRGCPSDFDSDGVLDGLDRCPETPPGAAVNEVGCPRDSDRDNVLDGIDQCTDTPVGAVVDSTGCPRDADGDRVFDGLDRCPNTPTGATVDRLGCPSDQDGDRVFDGIDRCPDTPLGVPVNAFGCPPAQDSDGDGVFDTVDRCPGTPAGARVDPEGCPLAPRPDSTPPPPAEDTIVLSRGPWTVPGSAFDLRGTDLKPEAYPVLDSIAQQLAAQPRLEVEVAGHAHDQVAPAENQRLSTQRALAVRRYLISRGVRDIQLQVRGYGANRLVTRDTGPDGRMLNRRTEIRVVGELGE